MFKSLPVPALPIHYDTFGSDEEVSDVKGEIERKSSYRPNLPNLAVWGSWDRVAQK